MGEDSKVKTVNVKLDVEDYDAALEAHKLGANVRVMGDIENNVIENAVLSFVK